MSIPHILDLARTHLGMNLAFVGRIHEDQEIFRWIAGDAAAFGLGEGQSVPLREAYCRLVLEGATGNIIADTEATSAVHALPPAHGSYIGVPIWLPDGSLYGMLCCRSLHPDPTLNERDTAFLRILASVLGPKIQREESQTQEWMERFTAIQNLIQGESNSDGLRMTFQPIVEVYEHRIVGVEALARFGESPAQAPPHWFAMARSVDLGVALECKALQLALQAVPVLPDGMFVSVNVSPEAILSGRLTDLIDEPIGDRLVLEVTEHAAIDDYPAVAKVLVPLRDRGVRLAIDDAGSGYASLRHILLLEPSFVKLDTSLIRDIHESRPRSALTSALITFGARIDAAIIAEGVETETELAALRVLGVPLAQGYYLYRPQPVDQLLGALGDEE